MKKDSMNGHGAAAPVAAAAWLACALACAGAWTGASAQTVAQTAVGGDAVPELPETVVTATRTSGAAVSPNSDVVVIPAQRLQADAGRTLTEVLAREAGVQFSANGGLGKASNLYLRGAQAGHVLLLIDGVSYGSATLGAPVWDNLPLALIDRVEVLKGPASALYGSDAIGGVVQVFTKKGRAGALSPQASLTLGSYGHRALAGGVSGGTPELTYALAASAVRETGFSATNDKSFNDNPDNDGFRQTSVSGQLQWKFAPDWSARLNLLLADGVSHSDSGRGAYDTHTDMKTRVLGLRLDRAWDGGGLTRATLSRAVDDSAYYGSPIVSAFKTSKTTIGVQHEQPSAIGTVLAGLERQRSAVDATNDYSVTSHNTTSVYGGLTGQAGRHNWQFNLRHDRDSQYGNASTGFASYGFQITPQWQAHAALGTSFKAPSFNDLYTPFGGDPNLRPEKGRNAELGVTYQNAGHELRLTRFDNRVRNLIVWQPVAPGSWDWKPFQVNTARLQGWNLRYRGAYDSLNWRADLELLDATDRTASGANHGKRLPRRARQQLTLGLDQRLGAFTWGASALLAGKRYENAANTQVLGGYGTLDAYASYALTPDWSLRLRVNNLTGKVYETARGYNQPGRAAYLTLNWQPVR